MVKDRVGIKTKNDCEEGQKQITVLFRAVESSLQPARVAKSLQRKSNKENIPC
jgi:hypothetical protein